MTASTVTEPHFAGLTVRDERGGSLVIERTDDGKTVAWIAPPGENDGPGVGLNDADRRQVIRFLAGDLAAIADAARYEYGAGPCMDGECEHAAELDEDAPEDAPCPLVEVRYATAAMILAVQALTVSADGDPLGDAEEIPVGEIRRALGELPVKSGVPNSRTWMAVPEPDADRVRGGRSGRVWVRSEYNGSRWWEGEPGAGLPREWHELLAVEGTLTEVVAGAVTAHG